MKNLLCIVALLFFPTFVVAQTVEHAILRIYVYEDGDDASDSMGSGVLVTNDQVVTNNHVIEDRRRGNNSVSVRFADGHRSWATIEHVNKSWDLALLRISPHATIEPVPVGDMPQAGDTLTIHGLGTDYEYKAQTGRMSATFYSPQRNSEDGWFEITGVAARSGDSGGPVTNAQGEWVGTLFGSGDSAEFGVYTIGSHIETIRRVFGDHLNLSQDTN